MSPRRKSGPGPAPWNTACASTGNAVLKAWLTLECPRHVASAVGESGLLDQVDGVILECVTLLASNTLYAQKDPTDYEPFQEALIEEMRSFEKAHPPIPRAMGACFF